MGLDHHLGKYGLGAGRGRNGSGMEEGWANVNHSMDAPQSRFLKKGQRLNAMAVTLLKN